MSRNAISESLMKNYLGLFDEEGEVSVEKTSDFLNVSKKELAEAFNLTADQLREERMASKTKDRVKELAAALEFVAETFEGNISKTKFWLNTPNPIFGGSSPKVLIIRGRYNKVLKFILAAKQAG